MLLREDFKHTVSLKCPHDGGCVREWISRCKIPFLYSTHNVCNSDPTVEYHFTTEQHAVFFTLKWS